tara:strand:+ start:53 stop:1765 length:1713 start_codon:yes stop_codon:yes gene_type:complete
MGIRIDGNNDLIKAVDDTLTIEGISVNTSGMVTATGGIKVGTAATIHSTGQFNIGVAHTLFANGNATHSGIVTASSFVGSGANLTGITQTTITDNANNRVITGSDTSNTLIAETGLTYNTQTLLLNNTSANPQFHLTSAANGLCEVKFGDANDATRGNIIYRNGTSGEALCFHGYNNTERMRITSDGGIGIGTTNPYVLNEPAKFNELTIGGKTEGAAITLRDDNGNVKGNLFTSDNTGAMIVRTITNHDLHFRTNNTDRLYIDSSGRFLIAKGAASTTTSQIQIGDGVSGYTWDVGDVPQILIAGLNNESPTSGTLNIALRVADENSNNMFQIHNRGGGNSDVGEVFMAGKVGIGTTIPTESLHLFSSTPAIRLTDLDTSGPLHCDIESVSGDLYLDTGSVHRDVVISSAGRANEIGRFLGDGGLTFNGDTATANALNDYEEGSFTPVLLEDGSTTYSQQNGKYTKIGNRVYFNVYIKINSHDGSSSTATGITLPFQNDFGTGTVTATVVGNDHWDTNYGESNMTGWMGNGTTIMRFYKNSGQNLQAITVDDIGDGGEIAIAGHYPTDS